MVTQVNSVTNPPSRKLKLYNIRNDLSSIGVGFLLCLSCHKLALQVLRLHPRWYPSIIWTNAPHGPFNYFYLLEEICHNFGSRRICLLTRYSILFYFIPSFHSDITGRCNWSARSTTVVYYGSIVISGKCITIFFDFTPLRRNVTTLDQGRFMD